MFESVRQWWKDRHTVRLARDLQAAGKGYAVRQWPFAATLATADRQRLTTTIQTWLEQQLSATKTPYGISMYLVGIGVVAHDGTTRTPLDRWSFTIKERADAPTVFAKAMADLETRTIPAATTHVEVYLLSLGDILNHQAAMDT